MKQEGGEVEAAAPPQTSDPINGLAWGQAAWPQRPLCPAASHPHLGVRAARDAKMFRSTKPARRSRDGGPDPSIPFPLHLYSRAQMCCLPRHKGGMYYMFWKI